MVFGSRANTAPVIASHHAGLLTTIATVAVCSAIVPVMSGRPEAPCARGAGAGRHGRPRPADRVPRASPYAQGKLLAICSPVRGCWPALARRSARPSVAGSRVGGRSARSLAAGLAVAILASDLLAYSYDRVAPTAQMEAIRQTGDHFTGEGLVLWNEFQEFAKYFARAAKISVPFEALTPQQVELRNPTYFYGHYFDLDEELLSFVEGYPIS